MPGPAGAKDQNLLPKRSWKNTHLSTHTVLFSTKTLTLSWFYTFWYVLHIFFRIREVTKKTWLRLPLNIQLNSSPLIKVSGIFVSVWRSEITTPYAWYSTNVILQPHFNRMISRIQQKACKFLWRFLGFPQNLYCWLYEKPAKGVEHLQLQK